MSNHRFSSSCGRWARVARGAGLLAALGGPGLFAHSADAAPSEGPPATAASAGIEGHVVAFELGDIVVDIAADRGAASGAVLELWRPLHVKHPVTGQIVSDRFLIGHLRLTQVRSALALALPEGKLAQPAQPGDIVVLSVRRTPAPHPGVPASAREASPTPSKPPASEPPASEPALGAVASAFGTTPEAPPPAVTAGATPAAQVVDPDSAEVSALFQQLRGASVAQRVLSYEAYVTHHPKGKYAVVLYEEAAQLRRLVAFENHTNEQHQSTLRNFEPPREARSNTPLTLALEVSNAPIAAVIHARNAGEVAYRTQPMRRIGEGYFSATIAAERLNSPSLEYFIEGVANDGTTMTVVGSATEPQTVVVEDVPKPKPEPHRPTTVTVSTDYADWNNLKGNDVVWQTEGSVGMRLRDIGVRAARMGFGVYRGIGGSLDELDRQKLSGRRVGLTYGYLEGEFGLSHFTSIIGRLVIGLENDGVNGGAQALLRIGNDRETNLTIGGEALGGIGLRGITELQLATFPRVPILFRTEVTNQPAGVSTQASAPAPLAQVGVAHAQGEVGARAIAQVGYRFLPDLVIALRGSYQGRTINHAGPGFGGAVTYQW